MSDNVKRYASEEYVDEKIVQADMKEYDADSDAYVKGRFVGYERFSPNSFTLHMAHREQIVPNEFCVLPLVTTSLTAATWKQDLNYDAMFGRKWMDMVLYFSHNGETFGMTHNLYMQSANATMIDDNNYKIVVKLPPLFYIYVIVDIGTLPEDLTDKFSENGVYLVCEDGHTVDQAKWYFIKVELLRRVKLSADFIQDTIARTEDVEALSEAISETMSEYDFFMKREKYTNEGFEPISYRYTMDCVYGHKYDYFADFWRAFPETIALNTPVLLYDFSTINGTNMWKYSTYGSEVKTIDGGYMSFKLFRQAVILGNMLNVSQDVLKSYSNTLVEIGTDNFMLDQSANAGWILYSIINLDTLPDEYAGMFSVIGQYYVKTKDDAYPARLVWECCLDKVDEYAIPTTIARTADVEALSETLAEKEDKIKWYDILNGNSTWAANVSGYQQIDFDAGYEVVSPTAPTADPSRTALWGAFGAAETLLNYSMRRFTSSASFTNLLLNFRALAEQSVLSLDEDVHFLSALADPTESPVDRYSHFCLSKVVENEETIWTLQIIKSNWRNICKLVFNETTNTIVENTSSPPGYGSVDATLTKADYAADAAAVGTAIANFYTKTEVDNLFASIVDGNEVSY